MRNDLLMASGVGAGGYSQVLDFVRDCNNITYSQFDSFVLTRVNLFALPEEYNFDELDQMLDKIMATLPAIKRIFARPITHIKDYVTVLPVEAVRTINNHTISHASVHSEMWENITRDGLKPRKLLTQDHEDNYAIYENLVFANLLDTLLAFIGKNIRFLNRVLYANDDLNFNLLERENHVSYFLAIGKLHTGYARDRDEYCTVAEARLNRLMFLDRALRSRLNSPLYKRCRGKGGALALKKTNVFRMHKDYHKVYLLAKWLLEDREQRLAQEQGQNGNLSDGYLLYCSLLSLFAIGHFNFVFDENQVFDFYHLNVQAQFCEWSLTLETVILQHKGALCFTFRKDRTYRVILYPCLDEIAGQKHLETLRQQYDADECLLVSSDTDGGAHISLDLFDIESFRRIQQILLRGMIYSDASRDVCPFCGRPIEPDNVNERGETLCRACRTRISSRTCSETGKTYWVTSIDRPIVSRGTLQEGYPESQALRIKHRETQMHFRNIVELNERGEMICPHCGCIHH